MLQLVLTQALSRAGYSVRSTATASALWRWVSEGQGEVLDERGPPGGLLAKIVSKLLGYKNLFLGKGEPEIAPAAQGDPLIVAEAPRNDITPDMLAGQPLFNLGVAASEINMPEDFRSNLGRGVSAFNGPTV